jgi:reactive intermediate/imine deaminase
VNRVIVIDLLAIISMLSAGAQTNKKMDIQQSEKIVREFLETVRSGKQPERAWKFMADTVLAHQMNSENPEVIKRTPQNYTEHVREFLTLYGQYDFEITELIAGNDKVYARWKQTGKHISDIDQYKATGLPLIEIGSAVYRVENGKIAEYWIQVDRQGFELQLQQNEKASAFAQAGTYPFAEAVQLGSALYISGQVGITGNHLAGPDFKAEADQVMKNLGGVLQHHQLSYKDLRNVTIYLTNMDDYATTNEVYRKYFDGKFPARVCIAVKELPVNARIEIAAVAQINPN